VSGPPYEWIKEYPENQKPDAYAQEVDMQVWCMLNGYPVHRFVIEKIPDEDDPEDSAGATYELGDMECAYFGGCGVETAYFLWAMAASRQIVRAQPMLPERVKLEGRVLATRLEVLAAELRKVVGGTS